MKILRNGRPTANTKTNFNENIYAEGKKDFVLGCAVRDFVIKAYLKKYFPDIDLGAFMSTIYACQFLCVKIYHLKLNLNDSKSKLNDSETKSNALIVRVVDGGPKQEAGDLPVVDIQAPIFFTEGYNALGHPTRYDTETKKKIELTAEYQLLKNVKLKYDYKSASIPGYNPEYFINKGKPKLSSIKYNGLKGITAETTEKNAAKSSNINNAPFIRFFIPSDERDKANSLYKNKTGRELPDGLFKEGPSSIETVEIEEPKIPESDGSLLSFVNYIYKEYEHLVYHDTDPEVHQRIKGNKPAKHIGDLKINSTALPENIQKIRYFFGGKSTNDYISKGLDCSGLVGWLMYKSRYQLQKL